MPKDITLNEDLEIGFWCLRKTNFDFEDLGWMDLYLNLTSKSLFIGYYVGMLLCQNHSRLCQYRSIMSNLSYFLEWSFGCLTL